MSRGRAGCRRLVVAERALQGTEEARLEPIVDAYGREEDMASIAAALVSITSVSMRRASLASLPDIPSSSSSSSSSASIEITCVGHSNSPSSSPLLLFPCPSLSPSSGPYCPTPPDHTRITIQPLPPLPRPRPRCLALISSTSLSVFSLYSAFCAKIARSTPS